MSGETRMDDDYVSVTEREDWRQLDTVMTNFDHSIDDEVAEQLKAEQKTYSQYSAWDFCGYVYRHGGKWRSEIWRYHSIVALLEAETLGELMEEASERWGEK